MRMPLIVVIAAVGTCCLAACNLDSGGSGNDWGPYYVRVIHTSQDSPTISLVNENGIPIHGQVNYRQGTRWQWLRATSDNGGRDSGIFEIRAFLPDFSQVTLATIDASEFRIGNEYTIVATGPMEDLSAVVAPNRRATHALTKTTLQLVHGASWQTALDFYLTQPDVSIDNKEPYATLDFGEYTNYKGIPKPQYQIRVTPSGTKDVIYDTGTLTLTFVGDEDNPNDDVYHEWNMSLYDNISAGIWPVRSILTDGLTTVDIPGTGASAAIRGIHASPVAPDADVILDDDFSNPLASGLRYLETSPYGPVAAGNVNLKMTETGNPDNILYEDPFSAEPTRILLEEDACYNFALSVQALNAPVLLVTQQDLGEGEECGVEGEGTGDPTEAYGVEIFVRGSYDDWAIPPQRKARFENFGNDLYQAEFEIAGSPEEMNFVIGSADQATAEFSAAALIGLDQTVPLAPAPGASGGAEYTAFLYDPGGDPDGFVLLDSRRSVATVARARFVEAYVSGSDRSTVYITESPNEPLGQENRAHVSFQAILASPYFAVDTGTRYITITTREEGADIDDDQVLVGPVEVRFEAGDVFTVLVPDQATAEEPLVLLDDLMP